MKVKFVSNGAQRLERSPQFQVRLLELRQTIQARHAAEFAQAGFFRRLVLRWQIAIEFRRERRPLIPSVHSLYGSRIAP